MNKKMEIEIAKRSDEIKQKLEIIRGSMRTHGIAGVRLRGVDWFSWATAGGSSVVILTSEAGIAEVFVTTHGAWVLTNSIERDRLIEEELTKDYEVHSEPWPALSHRPFHEFIRDQVPTGRVASDRPSEGEVALPVDLVAAKRKLLPSEIERYRELGQSAAEAMTETLSLARPKWTEAELAAQGSQALWRRGIHPTLTLVGGESRVARFRHPTATSFTKLDGYAMLVFCARKYGLYANLTRFVFFRKPTVEETKRFEDVARVEAVAFDQSQRFLTLAQIYEELDRAYGRLGYPREILKHHQGGTTGYLSREIVATPDQAVRIEPNTALAWNPSLPGAKIEDTVVVGERFTEVLTTDPKWPTQMIEGCKRPDLLVRP